MHSEMLTDILVLRKNKMMVVGNIKGFISLWNISNLEYKDQLKDVKYKHKKGII